MSLLGCSKLFHGRDTEQLFPPPQHNLTHYFTSAAMQSAQDGASPGTPFITTCCSLRNLSLQQHWESQDSPTMDGHEEMDSLPPPVTASVSSAALLQIHFNSSGA